MSSIEFSDTTGSVFRVKVKMRFSQEDPDYESYTTDIRNLAEQLDQEMADGSIF